MELQGSKQKRLLLIRNIIIVALTLVLILAFIIVRRLQRQRKFAEQEIVNTRQLLSLHTKRLQQNSELIEHLQQSIEEREQNNSPVTAQEEDILKQLRCHTLLRDEDWLAFKLLFSRIHKDFFVKLSKKYPDLSQGEMRFVALLKLGLSINAMANALGISPDSVRKARYRLLKKLDIGEEELLQIIADK